MIFSQMNRIQQNIVMSLEGLKAMVSLQLQSFHCYILSTDLSLTMINTIVIATLYTDKLICLSCFRNSSLVQHDLFLNILNKLILIVKGLEREGAGQSPSLTDFRDIVNTYLDQNRIRNSEVICRKHFLMIQIF